MVERKTSWLKDNLFIVAALALPLVVIVFFLVATGIPRLLVADPQYDLLFAVERYEDREYMLRYRVVDGRLRADARLVASPASWPHQTLYRFDARTLDVHEIDAAVPEAVRQRLHARQTPAARRRVTDQPGAPLAPEPAAPAGVSFDVAPTAGLLILPGQVAPDGYEFRSDRPGDEGLFGALFGMGARRSGFSIANRGRVVALPTPDRHAYRYYHSATLLGWVAP